MAGAIDINRGTTGVDLTPTESDTIWQDAAKQSAVLRLARRVTLPGNGARFNILGESTPAQFVDETAPAPVKNPQISNKTMIPYKLAKMVTVSKEFARDRASLTTAIENAASQGIAQALDQAVLTGDVARPSAEHWDVLYDSQSVALGSNPKYGKLVSVYSDIANADGTLSGWALSPQGINQLIGMTDGNGRPLITSIDASSAVVGNVLGGPVVKSPWGHKAGTTTGTGKSATTSGDLLGIAGDWNHAYVGVVQGINLAFSDQAAIELNGQTISTFQRDLIAVKVSAEVGFLVDDKNKFVAITA